MSRSAVRVRSSALPNQRIYAQLRPCRTPPVHLLLPFPLEQRCGGVQRLFHPQVVEDLRCGLRLVLRVEPQAELLVDVLPRPDEQDLGPLMVQEVRRVERDEATSLETFLQILGEPGSTRGRLRWPPFYLIPNPRNTHLGPFWAQK
jgi:hypothetical protein